MFKKDTTPEVIQILSDSLKEVTSKFIEELARVEMKHFEQLEKKEVTSKFIEELARVEMKHFEQLEKQSTKQLQILERQTKDFIGVMEKFIEASKPPVSDKVESFLDNLPQRENTIEKEEPEEFNLDEIPRIPMMGNNIGVQFEGDESIHPINIE